VPRRITKTANGVRLDDRKFKKSMKKLKRYLTKRSGLPGEVFKEWKRVTPRGETGTARRSNKLRRTNKGYTISGQYDYSGVIDRGEYPNPPKEGTGKTSGGYSRKNLSKARPYKGLVEPSLQYTIKRFKRFIRRLK
jgi:hypothetical protein